MSIIEFEIEEIRKLCENVVPNSKIIACIAAPLQAALVRVDIEEHPVQRQVTVCLRFPEEGYPHNANILVELKSRYLSAKFLEGLATLCEQHARTQQPGKPQGLHVLRFVQQYLHENPLCVCIDEIQQLRRDLGETPAATAEQLKLKQRSSSVQLTANGGEYFYRVRAVVPEDYPLKCIDLQEPESNLPAVLIRYLNGQSREIARQCVERPLRQDRLVNFQPVPSLYRTLKFCLEATRDFHAEKCPICEKTVLPKDPKKIELNENNDAFVERVYCGHIFHQGCLKHYLQQPPFPKGGKLCPANRRHPRSDARSYLGGGVGVSGGGAPNLDYKRSNTGTCNIRLAHDRWVVNVKVAESRWAQKQARERELQEVVDFLQ